MMKAKTITHEGAPGPNWLDRCRSTATPGRLFTLTALGLLGGTSLFIVQKVSNNDSTIPATASQQNISPSTPQLQVRPLIFQGVQTQDMPRLQSTKQVTAPRSNSKKDNSQSTATPSSFNTGYVSGKSNKNSHKKRATKESQTNDQQQPVTANKDRRNAKFKP